jgi:hypothetical protein
VALLLVLAPAAIAANGDISTFAGNGVDASSGDNGQATSASLRLPISVTQAPDGSVYVADYLAHVVRRISTTGVITTVAGNGTQGFSGDGGQARSAALSEPRDVATQASAPPSALPA